MTNSEDTIPIDSNVHLSLLKRKRYALEQLIEFSKNIVDQGQALDDILVLSRPSQAIPDKVRLQLMEMVKSLEDYPDNELQERLTKIDKLVENGVASVVVLAQSVDQFEEDTHEVINKIEHIKELTSIFRKRTKLAIAIRITLQERGITTNRLQLEFDQDTIAERVSELKDEELACRHNIKAHIEEVILECKTLLSKTTLPVSLRKELVVVQRVMKQNLEHVNKGKSINTMPVNFEIIVMGDSAPAESHSAAPPKSVSPANVVPNKPIKATVQRTEKKSVTSAKKLSFFKRLIIWLSAPLSVTWKQAHLKENKVRPEKGDKN